MPGTGRRPGGRSRRSAPGSPWCRNPPTRRYPLRAAGTAALAGYDTTVSPARCGAIARRVVDLFPALRNVTTYESWAGLRPATPGNVPIVGRTRLSNLFLNTGHGTLGWTLACGSGR